MTMVGARGGFLRIAKRSLATLPLLIALSAPRTASAQAEDQAAARSLFNDGKRLLHEAKYEEARQKLEAASKLYTSAGILLNLGDCYEKIGRTASAWEEFNEAAAVAGRSNRETEKLEALRRAEAVEKKLTRLAIRVPHPVTGLVVTRDGAEVASGALGVAIPVDPGSHAVRARAPGFQEWTRSVDTAGDGQTATVDVPELTPATEAAAAPPPKAHEASAAGSGSHAAPPPESPKASESHPNILAWTLVGAGAAVGIGGGVLVAIESKRSQDASDRGDQETYDSAKTLWTVGLVGAIVGGVAAASGVVLLVMDSGPPASTVGSLRADPWMGKDSGGVRLVGTW